MSKDTRRQKILTLLQGAKEISSSELSRIFGVTEETIRKDLSYLCDQGYVLRTFGGASYNESRERSLALRNVTHYEEKKKIAMEAIKYINPNESIALDSGSTVIELSRYIESNSNIVAVTNSFEILNILSHLTNVTVISSGGKLRLPSMSFSGRLAEDNIASFNFQRAFISAEAIDLKIGVMDANESEVFVKRCMIGAAKEVYVLADHSKFGALAHITTCPIGAITAIITDDGIDPDTLQAFRHQGVRVIVAE